MKKIAVIFTAAALGVSIFSTSMCEAAHNPTCVLMKFTDDTRYDRIESNATLSDLVMEKLLMSGKFNFKETKVINEDLEKRLYDERAEEFANAKWSMYYGNYSVLFEGAGFNEKKAQTISTAHVGQFVSPDITREIGRMHKADYLIQGTIINLGTGNWWNNKIQNIVSTANTAASIMGSTSVANFLGPFAGLASSLQIKEGGIGVRADLRLIKASTGEVVWQNTATGFDSSKEVSVAGVIKVGSDKLTGNMYYKAMENTAQIIADTLIADYDAGKMFVK